MTPDWAEPDSYAVYKALCDDCAVGDYEHPHPEIDATVRAVLLRLTLRGRE